MSEEIPLRSGRAAFALARGGSAQALWRWVPLEPPEVYRAMGCGDSLDQPHRVRLFCDAYGLDRRSTLIDTILHRTQTKYDTIKTWGEAGRPGFAEMWSGGQADYALQSKAFLRARRKDLRLPSKISQMELSASRGVARIVGIRRCLVYLMAAVTLAACETAGERPAGPSFQARSLAQNVCSGYTCDGPGAQPNAAYPYRLNTHCGVLGIRFDGRPFYVEAVDPSTVTIGLDNPEDAGTMTLLSPHTAVFRAAAGKQIRFVDAPPGVIGQPYPFRVLVPSGGNRLIDRGFAGRQWQAEGALPGIIGPPAGPKGQDAVAEIDGTMTLTGPETAVFRSHSGAQVRFALVGPVGCM